MLKKAVALLLSLCLIGTMIVPTMAGAETAKQVKTAAFIGDSLSAGFQMGFGIDQAYDYSKCLVQDKTKGASNYYWAYPFQFGELVYGEDSYRGGKIELDAEGNPVDNEVQMSILNYGISGAQADDINNILHDLPLRAGSAVEMLRAGFVDAAEKDPLFYADMRENVGEADLVAVAIGGNDIYQNFVNGFQMSQDAGFFGSLFYQISNNLMMEYPVENVIQMLGGMINSPEYPVASDTAFFAAEETEMPEYSANPLANLNMGEELLKFLAYYSKLNIGMYFMGGGKYSILNQWKANYQEIVEQIAALEKQERNRNGQIALISQFNPFGQQNYLNMLKERLNSDEFLSIFHKEDLRTVARIVRTLLSKLTAATVFEAANPNTWQSRIANAINWAFDQLLPLLDLSVEYVYDGEPTWYVQSSLNLKNDPTLFGIDLEACNAYMKFMAEHGMEYNYFTQSFTDPTLQAEYEPLFEAYMTGYTQEEFALIGKASQNPENYQEWQGEDPVDMMDAYAKGLISFVVYTPVYNVEDDEAVKELLADLSYPMMVAMIGRGLQPVYDEMNRFIKGIADQSATDNIVYVDISDTPSNGRFDPHPGVNEHEWIANRIYETLVEVNGGTAFKGGNYVGEEEAVNGSKVEETAPVTHSETVIDLFKLVVKRTLPAISALMSSDLVEQTVIPAAVSVLPTLMALTGTVVAAPVVTAAILSLPEVDLTDTPAFTALMALTEAFLK